MSPPEKPNGEGCRILVIATKSPWPPVDGGRAVLWHTLGGLAQEGHRVTLVAPVRPGEETGEAVSALRERCDPHLVDAVPRSAPRAVAAALRSGDPLTVARHRLRAVKEQVAVLVGRQRFDVVHVEQVQAWPQAAAARRHGLPVVHRAQNVEGELWRFAAHHRSPLVAPLFLAEARRLERFEAKVVRRAAVTVAFNELDAVALRRVVGEGGGEVVSIPAPFPGELPPAREALDGRPAVVLLASGGWLPNRDLVRSFAARWHEVRATLPGAVLHLFSEGPSPLLADGVVRHPPPADSRTAFPAGAICVVPSRHATGIPVKALEAWARGLPVLASAEAVAGLEATPDGDVLAYDGVLALRAVLERLEREDGLRERLVAAGRATLARRHEPASVAGRLVELYRRIASRQRAAE